MPVHELTAKTILRKHKRIDSWFLCRYGLNLYCGCAHNCAYCDGRAETYRVAGTFGEDVGVKVNAVEVLDRELDPARRRKPLAGGYVAVGGGVGDSFQPAEDRYGLTARAMDVVSGYGFGLHLLTKSDRVAHHADRIAALHRERGALVSFSFSSVNPRLAALFEPGAASPARRLRALASLKAAGVPAGVFLMPVIPFVSDTLPELDRAFRAFKDAGADYVVCGGMTLKEGRQRDHFMGVLNRHYPHLAPEYASVYGNDRWGRPKELYARSFDDAILMLGARYKLPLRIPVTLTGRRLPMNDRITVILEQLDYLARLRGGSGTFGQAARAVAALKEPVEGLRAHLKRINGIGTASDRLIREVLDTGTSAHYKRLLYHQY